jgi:hypothetical protein
MDPITGAAALSAVGSLYQLGTGIQQGIRGRRLGRTPRPNYNIPNEITDNVNLAKKAYNASTAYGIPGQGKIEAANNRSAANAMEGIKQSQQSPAAILAGYASIDQNSKNTNADLGFKAAQFRANEMNAARGTLMGANRILAQYRDQQFNTNQMQPYNNTMNAAAALRQGAITNTYGALNNMGGLASGMMLRGNGAGGYTTTTGAVQKIGGNGVGLANAGTGLKTTPLSKIGMVLGEVNQFKDLYRDPTYAAMRKKYPYNTMSDYDFYRAMADSQAGPLNTNP